MGTAIGRAFSFASLPFANAAPASGTVGKSLATEGSELRVASCWLRSKGPGFSRNTQLETRNLSDD
jgi:hypothetical protein